MRHFLPSEVADIMAHGNPNGYNFNSHTSYLSFIGQKGRSEDNWNKWEYDPDTQVLTLDTLGSVDDRAAVQLYLDRHFAQIDKGYIRNLYGRNQGHRNQGDGNQGHRNQGHGNLGHGNQGHWNQGDWNQGDRNQGHGNQGDGNQGHWNQGHGNRCNYGNGYFNTQPTRTLFNVVSTPQEIAKAQSVNLWSWYILNEWVNTGDMTANEKKANPSHATTKCFLRTYTPEQAWSKCPKAILAQIQALPHFDPVVFLEISGIDVRKKPRRAKGGRK